MRAGMIMKKNKYHNVKISTPEGNFDSKKEYRDWCYLKTLLKAGEIDNLERQKEFQLIPTIYTQGGTLKRISYKADFFFHDKKYNKWVVVDSKGFKTDVYALKKRLMLWLYPHITFIERGKSDKTYNNIMEY